MGKTVKIAISLPSELLASAERARAARGETRSEFVRQAIEARLARDEQQAAIDQYIEGYRRDPESEDEILIASLLATKAIAQDPWE